MDTSEYDVIVLGGGPAGYTAALKASRLGGKVLLAEKSGLGGTCLNRGCIPAKTYLKTAELIHELEGAARRGIIVSDPRVSMDMEKALSEKNRVVRKLTGGVASLLSAAGVTVVKGEGRLLNPRTAHISGYGKVNGRSFILAGGSKVKRIPVPGAELPGVLTSDEILDIQKVPKELVILGGGVIGVEMAMIFSSFGSRVTVIELEDRILPFMDREISEGLERILKRRGVNILCAERVRKIEASGETLITMLSSGAAVTADTVLLSAGREADLSCLGDVELRTENGRVLTDEHMQSSLEGIFVPGDLNGLKMLAHAACKMGETAAVNAMAVPGELPVSADLRFVPSVVYSFPEAAGVGLTGDDLADDPGVVRGVFPLSANGRALSAGMPEGFVKILADSRTGEILGVHILGPGASEIINEAAALMAMEITVHELAEIIHGHPTVSEALMEAAADCLGQCLHLPAGGNGL